MTGVMLVTGGSRGIGAAICRRAAQAGWDVAVNYHGAADKAAGVVAEVEAMGRRAIAVQADTGVLGGNLDRVGARLSRFDFGNDKGRTTGAEL